MSLTRDAAQLLVRVMTLTLLFGIFALPTLGQTNKADILGTITDSNGAAVQGATVTIIKVDTNATRTLTTGSSGEYQAPSLDIGTYKVTVTKQGFQTVTQENVILQTSDRLRIDLTLAPGNVTGVVTVTSGAPLVETESSNRGSRAASLYAGTIIEKRGLMFLNVGSRNTGDTQEFPPPHKLYQ